MTLAELRSLARSIANVDENRLPDTELNAFINNAKDEMMELNRFRFGEALITTAFVADTQTINPAPTSGRVLHPTDVWYAGANGEKVTVKPLSWAAYVEHYGTAATSATGTGDPSHFTVYGEDDNGNPTFYLGPIPDEDKTPVFVSARITFDDLSADADHNQLTDRAGLALVYKALILAAPFLENSERVPEWEACYKPIVTRLSITHVNARSSAKHAFGMQEPG